MNHDNLVVIAIPGDEQDPVILDKISNRATSLAAALHIPLLESARQQASTWDFALKVSSGRLALQMAGPLAPGPVSVDFTSPAISFRIKNAITSQAIAKAVGIKPGVTLNVLDATAGLGKDAFLLAVLGCKVTMMECDAVIHAMLQDGMRRAADAPDHQAANAVTRMQLLAGEFGKSTDSDTQFDVVYLDPMFPVRRKNARVKKEMFVLQNLLSYRDSIPDPNSLLEPALTIAKKRVVVKRPRHADNLAGVEPSYKLKGSSSRYDIYLSG